MKTATNLPRTTGNLRNTFAKLAATLALALAALTPATARAGAPSSGVSFLDVMADAKTVVGDRNDRAIFMIKGESMEPIFGKDSVIVVNKPAFSDLRAGMIVVYKDAAGDFVAHRLVEHTANGWTVMGQNNNKMDPGLVTSDNFQGALCCTLHYKDGTDALASVNASAKPTLALAKRY